MSSFDQLTRREYFCMALVIEGKSNKQIAAAIGTTEGTVKNYMRSIFDKTGMGTRLELAMLVMGNEKLLSRVRQESVSNNSRGELV